MGVSRQWSVACVAVAAVVGAACGGGDGDSGGARDAATFTSPVYGYSLEHPAGWTTVPAEHELAPGDPPATADGAVDVLGRGADTRVSRMDLPGLLIAAQPVAAGTDARAWAEEVGGIVGFMKGCARPDDREALTVDGEPAELLVYDECPERDGYLHLWATAVHDGMAFHIVWFDDVGAGAASRSEFERVLESFAFEA